VVGEGRTEEPGAEYGDIEFLGHSAGSQRLRRVLTLS
jgi:hypothetical protein